MTARAPWLLFAAVLCAMVSWRGAVAQTASPPVDAAGARAAMRACSDRIGPEPVGPEQAGPEKAGLPALEQRCPGLAAALQAAGIRPLIIASSQELFDRGSLRRLPVLMHGPTGSAPDVAALAPVLRGLHRTVAPPRSWWRRVWDWLVEHLAPRQPADTSSPWLTGILRLLPRLQWLWTAIIWGTFITLPIAVVIIVVREVRAMGRPSVDAAGTAGPTAGTGPVESRLAMLRRAPSAERPAQLFALLIARLVAAGRLPPDRSLTHREIARRALLDDAEQRQLIESLARLAERQLYSELLAAPAGVEVLLARGEDLYTTGWGRPAGS
jgi:hypothetical protein